jgi:hypothetical protein
MKSHWLIAGLMLVVAGGWGAFASRSEAPDPVYARDKLVGGDAVMATFKADTTDETYEFTAIKGKGWVWTRTTPNAAGLAGTLLYNGKQHMVQVGEACFVPLEKVAAPFIPGVTTTAKLGQVADFAHNPDGSYTYEVAATELAPEAARNAKVSITEQLAELEQQPSYAVTISGKTPSLWYGSYRLSRATAAQRQAATALLDRARPSGIASIEIRERLVSLAIGSVVQGPFTIVHADDCPGTPVQLRPGSNGGQMGGARITVPDVTFAGGLRIEQAMLLPMPIYAPREDLFEAGRYGPFAPTAVPPGSVLVVPNGGAMLAVQIASCSPGAVFRC